MKDLMWLSRMLLKLNGKTSLTFNDGQQDEGDKEEGDVKDHLIEFILKV